MVAYSKYPDSVFLYIGSDSAPKDPGILRNMKSLRSLLLRKGTEIFIAIQQDLVLVAVAGQDVFDQRLCPVQHDGILVPDTLNMGEVRGQKCLTVLQPELFIQLLGGQDDAAVELLHQVADLSHVLPSIGAAHEDTARFQHPSDFPENLREVFTVEQYMIGNDQIKGMIRTGDLTAVEGMEGEAGIILPNASSGIAKHPFGNIRKQYLYMFRDPAAILCPESAVAAANLQDLHAVPYPALLEKPWEPALSVSGVIPVQPDACRDIGGVLILGLQALLHPGQMDQIQHMAPIDLVLRVQCSYRILNGAFHQLHLFDPVLYQLLLQVQGIAQKMIVRISDGHLPDIVQRESQVFQQKDLLQSCKIGVRVEAGTGRIHIRGLEYILFVIEADRPDGYIRQAGELTGGIVAGKFHEDPAF